MRPVYISHAGLWCAAGGTPAEIRQALATRKVPAGRLGLLQETFPYAFATRADRTCQARLEAGLEAVGARLDLPSLSAEAPLLLGSSSLLIGTAEELGWPLPPGFALSMAGLANSLRSNWKLEHQDWTFSCGCTSAVHALAAAVGLIASGTRDEAVVVGVEIRNRSTPAGFASLQLLSTSAARPMDKDRSGLVLGEAVAAVRLTSRPAQWRIHAPALASDVTSSTGHALDGSSIARTMHGALDQAGVAPRDLQAIKLQGSGALETDAVEARALRLVFGEDYPPLLSIKAALGHTLGACGVAELVALLHCGEEGWLPPTAGFRCPDPELRLDLIQQPIPWLHGPILLNIQGFGGGLASWVVERP
jgi:3-oxoacyl-[acyl-carrier-protein] synthase-1